MQLIESGILIHVAASWKVRESQIPPRAALPACLTIHMIICTHRIQMIRHAAWWSPPEPNKYIDSVKGGNV